MAESAIRPCLLFYQKQTDLSRAAAKRAFILPFGAVDSMGKEVSAGFEGINIHDYKERYIYLGSNDTFLRLNLRSFLNAVILDIDTGLVSAFPNL